MTLLTHMLGWSLFGLGSRLWQLGIQQRPLHSNLWGHAIAISSFSGIGYFAHDWQERSRDILAEQRRKVEAKNVARAASLEQTRQRLDQMREKIKQQHQQQEAEE
ncbi:hypothetical protein AURDEDRAFT_165063 [Auricularia subglabra TFB-10046 SS5]|nr:hypothetical protein AURDEDRAFT_165063 [Auricularia subglabra TFB-10046 SS5]